MPPAFQAGHAGSIAVARSSLLTFSIWCSHRSRSRPFYRTAGLGWLVRLLADYGFDPHLVHPLRCKAIASAQLKNDKVDAAILARLLRADLLPEAWIAPAEVRQLRALLRHRASLVRLGTQQRNPDPRGRRRARSG